MRWLEPQAYAVTDRSGATVGEYELAQGCFMDEAELLEIRQAKGFRQPDWADAIGLDEYGLYADWGYRGVTQRFRWIPPGEFLMGSPREEPERESPGTDETQHPVMLARGFWLADTACTQALWEAVTGENTSVFQNTERPVENVSWEQVQGFIERLNRDLPGLDLRLPSEAEWEYACRAGTPTPFWFGDGITPEQANYDGNYPYAGGSKGRYRQQTIEVKVLPANGWGLYQMHGNVWEWCQDWYGEYAEGKQLDPGGPRTGGLRVLRGGSWGNDGRGLRSAYRYHWPPGLRDGRIGFRLARGRTVPQAGPAGNR